MSVCAWCVCVLGGGLLKGIVSGRLDVSVVY